MYVAPTNTSTTFPIGNPSWNLKLKKTTLQNVEPIFLTICFCTYGRWIKQKVRINIGFRKNKNNTSRWNTSHLQNLLFLPPKIAPYNELFVKNSTSNIRPEDDEHLIFNNHEYSSSRFELGKLCRSQPLNIELCTNHVIQIIKYTYVGILLHMISVAQWSKGVYFVTVPTI